MPLYALGSLVPQIHPDAFVHPDATIIGDVVVGEGSSVWPQAVIRGDTNRITVGRRTSIQDGSVIHTNHDYPTTVGDECVIGHLVHLECCVVQDGALVGTGAIVLHRSVIESGAWVGAGAVVPNDMIVPSGAMALGVPARIRPDSVDRAAIVDAMEHYVQNAARFRAELRRI